MEGYIISNLDTFKKKYGFDSCEYNVVVKSNMAVGGEVLVLCSPVTREEIIACIDAAKEADLPVHVCGNLSNTIIKDGGYKGVLLKIADNYSGFEMVDGVVTVKAGTPMVSLAKELTAMGYGGLEFAGGIPGTIGGGVRMNAGAYGGQMSDVIKSVTYYDGEKLVTTDKLGFGYRESVFEDMEGIVVIEATLEPKAGAGDMEALTEYNRRRSEKQPLELPSCGSVFKRPKDGYASKMIDDCGLKGLRVGGASVSEKHCGFIVNDRGGTARDVLELMEKVRSTVYEKTGTLLESEWVIIGED